jgi:hypothetical protein
MAKKPCIYTIRTKDGDLSFDSKASLAAYLNRNDASDSLFERYMDEVGSPSVDAARKWLSKQKPDIDEAAQRSDITPDGEVRMRPDGMEDTGEGGEVRPADDGGGTQADALKDVESTAKALSKFNVFEQTKEQEEAAFQQRYQELKSKGMSDIDALNAASVRKKPKSVLDDVAKKHIDTIDIAFGDGFKKLRRVFVRYGEPAKNEKGEYEESSAYAGSKKGAKQEGVSVFEAGIDPNTGKVVIRTNEAIALSLLGVQEQKRKVYLVEGTELKERGEDFEPQISPKDIRIVKEVNPDAILSEDNAEDVDLSQTEMSDVVSEAYHAAKADGSNPELVKAVEDLLAPKSEQAQKAPKKGTERKESLAEGQATPLQTEGESQAAALPIAEAIDGVEARMPLAKEVVDGRAVRESIPNESSVESSLNDYMELDGVREVKMSEIKDSPKGKTTSGRVKKLANEIKASGEINPLIVVVDKDGPYVLEGSHRIDALHELGAKSFPAKVVIDLESLKEAEPNAGEKYDAAKRFRNEIWIPYKKGEITGKEADERFDALSKETGISHIDIQNTAADYGDFTRPRPTSNKTKPVQEAPVSTKREQGAEGEQELSPRKKKAQELRAKAEAIRKATEGTAMVAPKVYAAALDAFAAILDKVDDVAQALKEWRGTREYKALVDADRDQIESELQGDLGDEYAGPEEKAEPKKAKASKGEVEKTLINRAYSGITDEEVRKEIEDLGLTRQVESREQAAEAGKQLIEAIGIDAAIDQVLDGIIKGAPAAYIYARAIDEIASEVAAETDEVRRGFLSRKEARLLQAFGKASVEVGQFSSMLVYVYENSDLGYSYEKKIAQYELANNGVVSEEVKQKFREYDTKIKDLQKRIKEAEEREKQNAAQEAITDIKEDVERKGSAKGTAKEAAKKLATQIRKAKLTRPNIFASATPAAVVWDTAVEAVASAIEGGATIADALSKGIDYIRGTKWYRDLTTDKQMEAEMAFEDKFSDVKRKSDEVEVIDGRIRIPAKMLREIVESGVTDVNDVIAAIRERAGDVVADFSDRDIRDAITGYGKKVNPRRDEVERKVSEMKTIGRLLSQIEDLENGIKKEKNPEKKQQISERVKRLRREANSLSRGLVSDEEKIEKAKELVKRQTEDLERRLRDKDFSRKKKPDPMLGDTELARLRREKQKVKEMFDVEINKAELKNRTPIRKFWDGALDIWSLPRAVMATGEMSFVLIQGLVPTIAHPKRAMRAFKKAFEHFASEKKAEEWGDFVKSQPYYDLMKASKLSLSEFDARLAAREEQFLGGFVNHIWDMGGYAPEWLKRKNPFKALERATVGYLNTMRILGFLDGVELLERQGKTFSKNPKNYKDLADVMNTFTGRSGLGKFENLSKPLSVVLFSPKNWLSIIKQTTPLGFYWLGRMTDEGMRPSVAQKVAVRDYMRFVTATASIVALAAAYLNNDDDEETGVELDPTSSDYLKIKLGNLRLDPWGGRQQMIVYQARMMQEAILNPTTGEKRLLGERPTDPDRLELTGKLLKQKLAPTAGMLVKFAQTKEKRGERVDESGNLYTPEDEIMNIYPMYWGVVSELYQEDPFLVEQFFALTAYGFFGGGISNYGTLDEVTEREFNKLRDTFRRENNGADPKGGDLQTMKADARELAMEKIEGNRVKREINEKLNPQYEKIDRAIASGVGHEAAVFMNVQDQAWFNDLDEDGQKYVMGQLRSKYLIPLED